LSEAERSAAQTRALEAEGRAEAEDAGVQHLVDPVVGRAVGLADPDQDLARVRDVEPLGGPGEVRLLAEAEGLGKPQVEVPDVAVAFALDRLGACDLQGPVVAGRDVEEDRLQAALPAPRRARDVDAPRQLVERVAVELPLLAGVVELALAGAAGE
jgi:hypothetical protein